MASKASKAKSKASKTKDNALEYKLAVLGGGGVGKSALTIRLVVDDFLEIYDPTIEDTYRKDLLVDEEAALLEIVDTAGQEEFVALRDQWITDARGFLLVYCITCRASFEEAVQIRERILRTKDVAKVPIVLVGNKCDLKEREVEYREGVEQAKIWDCPFFETSAKTKLNTRECFESLVREIRAETKRLNDKRKKKKKIDCAIL